MPCLASTLPQYIRRFVWVRTVRQVIRKVSADFQNTHRIVRASFNLVFSHMLADFMKHRRYPFFAAWNFPILTSCSFDVVRYSRFNYFLLHWDASYFWPSSMVLETEHCRNMHLIGTFYIFFHGAFFYLLLKTSNIIPCATHCVHFVL